MRYCKIIFIFLCYAAGAQNELVFLKNGEVKKGSIISIGTDYIFFRSSDTAITNQKFAKSEVLLLEKYDGKVIVFAQAQKKTEVLADPEEQIYHHSIGLQPFNFLMGRLTASYEYLNKNGSIGFLVPLSLTFDPVGIIYEERTGGLRGRGKHKPGFNFIGGADINFYVGKKNFEGFFLGPRVRYGVNMFIANVEAWTLQTQLGWRLNDIHNRFVQQISVGFGFVRILSSAAGNRISPEQSHAWMSVNYRIGFTW
jgi:hypothetical protein